VAKLHFLSASAFFIFVSCLACGQAQPTGPISWFHPDQEVHIADVPSFTAPSADSSEVLTAALETILHDPTMRCAKGSALEAAVHSGSQSLSRT
jgi:hypothetical protein